MSASSRDHPSPHHLGSAPSPQLHQPEAFVSHSKEDLDPPSQTSDTQQEPSQEQDQQPPPPPFDPVFTLLTNTTTNTTTHPRVHYIFSDDDPSTILATANDPTRRALLIDLHPTQPSASASPAPAWSVSWAASLSPDFALTSSRLTDQQQQQNGGDVMLRLEGVEREPVDLKQVQQRMGDSDDDEEEGGGSGQVEQEDQEALVEDFKRRMGVLQKVIDEAQKRDAVVAAQLGHEDDDEEDDEQPDESAPRPDDDGGKQT